MVRCVDSQDLLVVLRATVTSIKGRQSWKGWLRRDHLPQAGLDGGPFSPLLILPTRAIGPPSPVLRQPLLAPGAIQGSSITSVRNRLFALAGRDGTDSAVSTPSFQLVIGRPVRRRSCAI
ncbi:hypothetical protein AFLA_008045 [Aspergillus flavus NRRL3357]|nr:hypothetical protein AFLA_008045 [Aspergillus flavus NRRL3357]